MKTTNVSMVRTAGLAVFLLAAGCPAHAVFLYEGTGVSVSVLSSSGPVIGTVANLIDLSDSTQLEPHTTAEHVFVRGSNASATFRFDLGDDYDLGIFHLWNQEIPDNWGVDDYTLTFRDLDLNLLSDLMGVSSSPGDGDTGAENIAIMSPSSVRYVDVFASGLLSGMEVMGIAFTGRLSSASSLPEPSGLALLGMAIVLLRSRAHAHGKSERTLQKADPFLRSPLFFKCPLGWNLEIMESGTLVRSSVLQET